MNDCNVSLTFPSGDKRTVCIKVEDEASGARVEVTLTLEDFALFISGLQEIPASLRYAANLDKWGMVVEQREVVLKSFPWDERNAETEKNVLASYCPEGFTPAGFTNSQRGFVMHYKRWTKAEAE